VSEDGQRGGNQHTFQHDSRGSGLRGKDLLAVGVTH